MPNHMVTSLDGIYLMCSRGDTKLPKVQLRLTCLVGRLCALTDWALLFNCYTKKTKQLRLTCGMGGSQQSILKLGLGYRQRCSKKT